MPGSGEQSGGTMPDFEIVSSQAATQKVVQLLQLTSDEAQPLKAQQWQNIEQLAGQGIAPPMQQAIRTVGQLLIWGQFETNNQPMPAGMVFVREPGGSYHIGQDARLPMTKDEMRESMRLLEPSRKMMHEGVQRVHQKRRPQIEAAIRVMLQTSPLYGLLKSFEIDTAHFKTSPLTEDQKAQRRAAAHQEATTAYGFDPLNIYSLGRPAKSTEGMSDGYDQDLSHWTGQNYALRQTFGRIELATGWQREPGDAESLHRARAYFLDKIVEANQKVPSSLIRGETKQQVLDQLIAALDHPSPVVATSSIDVYTFDLLRNSFLSEDWGVRYDLFRNYYNHSIDTILRPNLWPPSYGGMLDTFVADHASRVFDLVTAPSEGISGVLHELSYNVRGYGMSRNRLFSFLNSVQGEWINQEDLRRIAKQESSLAPPWNSLTAPEIAELKRQAIGHVLRRPENDQANRLIMTAAHNAELPCLGEGEDLILNLTDPFGAFIDPLIPGYKLVSRQGTMYGFCRADSDDPYTGADLPISASAKKSLLQEIAEADLPLSALIRKLQRTSRLSALALGQIIAEQSRYDLPKHTSSDGDFSSFVGFLPHIRRKKLFLQCRLAGQFLKLAAGREDLTAEVIGGFLLPAEGVPITRLGHAQTMVFDSEGKAVIVDATPRIPRLRRLYGDGRAASRTPLAGEIEAPPIVYDKPPEVTRGPVAPPPVNEKPKDQQGRRIREQLEEKLSILLREPDKERLFDTIVRLSPDNPIYRAWSLAVRATTYNELDRTEAVNLDALLRQLQETTKADQVLTQAEKAKLSWHYALLRQTVGEFVKLAT